MKAYRLTLSLRSPFARRIRLALHRMDVRFEEDVVNVFEPPTWLFKRNPLGLVPILTTPEERHLADSDAILEHLDETLGRRIWPSDAGLRFDARSASVLAKGIMTATVAYFLETQRTDAAPSRIWMDEYRESIERTLADCRAGGLSGTPWQVGGGLTQAGWDLAVALEYLELRMPELKWKGLDPGFGSLLELARELDFFGKTTPPAA